MLIALVIQADITFKSSIIKGFRIKDEDYMIFVDEIFFDEIFKSIFILFHTIFLMIFFMFYVKGCSFTSLIASSSWSNPTKKVVEKLAYQHIPTSNIPTRWEYGIMMKGFIENGFYGVP